MYLGFHVITLSVKPKNCVAVLYGIVLGDGESTQTLMVPMSLCILPFIIKHFISNLLCRYCYVSIISYHIIFFFSSRSGCKSL